MDYTCTFCNLCFSSKFELFTHSYSHKSKYYKTDDDMKNVSASVFTCNRCKKSFKRHKWFLQHVNRFCMASYECFLCSKTFIHIRNLKKHFQLHTYETKFLCATCNKAFYRQDKLLLHNQTHSQELFCSVCKKSFKTKKDLKSHRQTHEVTELRACNLCPKKYKRKHSLKSHLLAHTNGSPHVCKYCKKRFWSGSHVRSHEKIHNFDQENNQCSCQVCGARCDANVLEMHMLDTHNGQILFECDICKQNFLSKVNLDYHQKSHRLIILK